MQLTNTPAKLVLPFANAGAKNTIPTASQIGITAGAASLVDGFPPLTRTPIAAGGVPPSGLDMNGILYALSAALRWGNAGGGYVYDATFANDSNVGGYPKGARVLRSDGVGYWLNTAENNTTDPENTTAGVAVAAGWVPDLTNGIASITMTSANVTLTPAQYGKPFVVLSGVLTANLNLIFPNLAGEWTVVNNCTGAFIVTAKTAAGTGAVVTPGCTRIIWGDGTNIAGAMNEVETPVQFDNSTKLATTGFVQRALGNLQTSLTWGGGTLTAAACGKLISLGTGASTLPLLSACPDGAAMYFINSGGGNHVISRQGADIISPDGSSLTSITLVPGDDLLLVKKTGGDYWMALFGSARLKYSTLFAATISVSGYQKLPSGLLVMWGQGVVPANSTADLSLPITPPNNFHQVVVSIRDSVAGGPTAAYPIITAIPLSASTFRVKSYYGSSSLNISYVAFGN